MLDAFPEQKIKKHTTFASTSKVKEHETWKYDGIGREQMDWKSGRCIAILQFVKYNKNNKY